MVWWATSDGSRTWGWPSGVEAAGYYNGVRRCVTARYCGVALALVALASVPHARARSRRSLPAAGRRCRPVELLAGGTLDLRWTRPPTAPSSSRRPALRRDDGLRRRCRSGRVVGVRPRHRAGSAGSVAVDTRVRAGRGRRPRVRGRGRRRPRARRRHRRDCCGSATLPGAVAAPPYWDTGWLVAVVRGRRSGRLPRRRRRAAVARRRSARWRTCAGAGTRRALSRARRRPRRRPRARDRPTRWTRPLEGGATGLRALDEQLVVGTTARARAQPRSRDAARRAGDGASAARPSAAPTADERRIYVVAYDHLLRAVDRRSRQPALAPGAAPSSRGLAPWSPARWCWCRRCRHRARRPTTPPPGHPALAIASAGEVAGETPCSQSAAVPPAPDSWRSRSRAGCSPLRRGSSRAPATLEGLPGTPVTEPAPAQRRRRHRRRPAAPAGRSARRRPARSGPRNWKTKLRTTHAADLQRQRGQPDERHEGDEPERRRCQQRGGDAERQQRQRDWRRRCQIAAAADTNSRATRPIAVRTSQSSTVIAIWVSRYSRLTRVTAPATAGGERGDARRLPRRARRPDADQPPSAAASTAA